LVVTIAPNKVLNNTQVCESTTKLENFTFFPTCYTCVSKKMRCFLLVVVFCLKAAQLSSTNFDDKHVSESSSSLSESPQSKSDSLQLKSQDSSKLESKVLSVRSESSQSNTKSLRIQAEASQSKSDSNVFKSISTATPPSEGDSPTRYSFYYTGYPQTFYVPDGVTSIIIDA